MRIIRKLSYIILISSVFVSLFSNPLNCLAKSSNAWELLFTMKADATGLSISNPVSLYVDSSTERYYIIDSGINRLFSFDKNGEPLSSFNAGGQLVKPVSMVKENNGQLLLIEKGKQGLTQIDLKSRAVKTIEIKGVNAKIYPQRIVVHKNSYYLLDKLSGNIFGIDDKYNFSESLICEDCQSGFADFKIFNDKLYALTQFEGIIFKYNEAGKLEDKIKLEPKPVFPSSFAVGDDGYFYVLERHNHKVSIFDNNGSFINSFLKPGEKQGNLYYPVEITFDPWGRLCIIDEGNGRGSVFAK